MATPTVFTIKLEGLGDSSGSMDDTTRDEKPPKRREGPTADDPRHEIPRGPATPVSQLFGPQTSPGANPGANPWQAPPGKLFDPPEQPQKPPDGPPLPKDERPSIIGPRGTPKQGKNEATYFLNYQSNPFSGLPIPGQGPQTTQPGMGMKLLEGFGRGGIGGALGSLIPGGGGAGAAGAAGAGGAGGVASALNGAAGAAALFGKVLTEGAKLVKEAAQTWAMVTRTGTDESLALMRGDIEGAEAAKRARHSKLAGKIGDVADKAGIPGAKEAGGGLEAIADARTAKGEEFTRLGEASRARMKELAGFNPAIAREQAISDVSKFKRDMGEASILGSRYAEFAKEQRETDNVRQQIAIAEGIEQLNKNAELAQEKRKEYQEKLEEMLKKLPKEQADEIRKLGTQKSPIEILLEGLPTPDLPAPVDDDGGDRVERARLNIPMLRG